ncbi:hypothetical protein MYX84_14675, partial [Acidobacteria bacterium AH-259-O06]|nr:hypothetical protein [Acidobacteria bacterium AH-259-O06]
GGPPRQLQAEFVSARYPTWSADGKHLLFQGLPSLPSRGGEYDWWVLPVDAGPPVKAGAFDILGRQGLDAGMYTPAGHWLADPDRVVFSAQLGDSWDLWQIRILPKTGQVTGTAERLTTGPGLKRHPSAGADGRLVFSSLSSNTDVWSLPMDPNQGKVKGEMKRLTRDASTDVNPFLSADGKKMMFRSDRSGNWDIWMKDLETGKETALTDTPSNERRAAITPDGSKVAYGAEENGKLPIYGVATGGGVPKKLCEDCGFGISHWSSDGKKILGGKYSSIFLLNVSSGETMEVLRHPREHFLSDPRFSPDDRWIAFHARLGRRRQLFIAPFRGTEAILQSEWIAVTDGSKSDGFSWWSPDGKLLYFISNRDGFQCIWAQPLDGASKQPMKSAFTVYHAHQTRRSLITLSSPAQLKLSVARDKIVFSMAELTGNIWMMEGQAQGVRP